VFTREFTVCIVLSLILFTMFRPTPVIVQANGNQQDLTGIKVAIYSGGTDNGHNQSRKALAKMFEWMNATVRFVVGKDIQDGALEDVDIFAVPAVSPYRLVPDLEANGLAAVEQFFKDGGSYFGICSGHYFEWNEFFHYNDFFLYNGELHAPLDEFGYGQMPVNISINLDAPNLDFSGQSENFTVTYWDSGYFSDFDANVTIVANYTGTQLPAMIAYEKANGTVFLSSVHPEFEENSDRDNTPLFDEFNDPDSEWDLMSIVSRWLIEASVIPSDTSLTTTTTQTSSMGLVDETIIFTSVGIVLIILAVVIRRFRKVS
jgi:glutamine amidotransferase-like uncharacterized protein